MGHDRCGVAHIHSHLTSPIHKLEPFQEFLRNQITIFSQVVRGEYFPFIAYSIHLALR